MLGLSEFYTFEVILFPSQSDYAVSHLLICLIKVTNPLIHTYFFPISEKILIINYYYYSSISNHRSIKKINGGILKLSGQYLPGTLVFIVQDIHATLSKVASIIFSSKLNTKEFGHVYTKTNIIRI